MHLHRVTAPSVEPLTLDQVKADRVITHDLHNDMLTGYITAAREMVEKITGRALMPQTWQQLHAVAECELDLVRWPVTAISSLVIDGEEQDITALMASGDLELLEGESAMLISPLFHNRRVLVQYTAGYTDANPVPEAIKKWMLLQIGSMYEHRESEIVGTITSRIKYTDGLINQYKIRRYWS